MLQGRGMLSLERIRMWSVLGPCMPVSVLQLMNSSREWLIHQTLSGLVQLPVEKARRVGRLGGSAIRRSNLSMMSSRG